MAFFTSSEPYSSTGTPASAASAMTTPVALATAIALALFTFQATRSSARDAGPVLRDRSPDRDGDDVEALRLGRRPAGLDRAGPHDDGLAVAAGHDRQAEPCHAGVDPEHAGIEHLFVQSRVAGGAEQSLRLSAGRALRARP